MIDDLGEAPRAGGIPDTVDDLGSGVGVIDGGDEIGGGGLGWFDGQGLGRVDEEAREGGGAPMLMRPLHLIFDSWNSFTFLD